MPKKKRETKQTFFQKHVGGPISKFLDSNKDAISRATRDLEQSRQSLAVLLERQRKHREQCDDFVRQILCPSAAVRWR